jgi:transcriptional regulator with XRE-family HTH domain
MSIFQNLGRALRWLRDLRGKKQYEVAEAAGITKGMLCAYETGKQRPSLETLDKLLVALGCGLVELHDALALVNGRYTPAATPREPARGRGHYPEGGPGEDELADGGTAAPLGEMMRGFHSLVRHLQEALQRLPPLPQEEDVSSKTPPDDSHRRGK